MNARFLRAMLGCAIVTLGGTAMPAQDANAPVQATGQTPVAGSFTLKVQTDLVLSDVVVRDRKTGLPVKGLTRDDFAIFENGKPQRLASFDAQNVDQALRMPETATVSGRAAGTATNAMAKTAAEQAAALRNHRLIVLFFDLSSLQPDDLERVQQAAEHFVNDQMQNADMVAAVSLGTNLSLDQDFTDDKQALLKAIHGYGGDVGSGFTPGATSTTNQTEDTTAFTADESEYNDINTDRELFAIASIAKALGPIQQKKSLLYFSGGIQRDGIENQASLRATINAAVRNNLSIYGVDSRGLQAIYPLGDASTGSLRGTTAFTGAALQNNLDASYNSQEVLATLSSDTGGKVFLDNNDFAPAFTQVQNDTSSYYVLGFHSTNPMRDGKYRQLEVRVNRPDVKVSYRQGYYAPADFQHSNGEQREQQLADALNSDLPATDIAVYLQPFFFRSPDRQRTNMPVALLVPGSQIPFAKNGSRDKATLDIAGNIKDAQGHVLQEVRDTVKLALDADQGVQRKNIQYATGFTLPPGTYHLKFVVRENESGNMGSFETDIRVPDLSKGTLKMSSVVLASQRIEPKQQRREYDNPLVYQGQQYVPNLPHVFRRDQSLYFYYEMYDPAKFAKVTAGDTAPAAKLEGKLHVLTSIELLRGNVKVFSTPTVETTTVNLADKNAIAFAFTVPLGSLSDGLYTCQVSVIDDAGGVFSFPRTTLMVRGGEATAQPSSGSGNSMGAPSSSR